MIDINSLTIDSEPDSSSKRKIKNENYKKNHFDKNIEEIEKDDKFEHEDTVENISNNIIEEILKSNLLSKLINLNDDKNNIDSDIDITKLSENINSNIENQENIDGIDIQYLNSKININETLENLLKIDSSIYDVSYNEKKNTEDSDIENININNRIEINDDINILENISNTRNTRDLFLNEVSKGEAFVNNNMEQNNIEETIKNIKIMKNEDIKELVVKLRPRELGDMHIKLLQENGDMKAILTVEDKDAFKMLNKNISELKNHIENFNVKQVEIIVKSDNAYSSDSFDKSFDEYRGNKEQSNNQKRNKQNELIDDKEVSIELEKDSSLNKGINLLA